MTTHKMLRIPLADFQPKIKVTCKVCGAHVEFMWTGSTPELVVTNYRLKRLIPDEACCEETIRALIVAKSRNEIVAAMATNANLEL